MVKKGFTLIELLVVVSIISLLVSILLPALNKARESARSVKCLVNLKTAGVAAAMYANDYKDKVVPACISRFDSYDVTFEVLLDKYINVLQPGFPDPYIEVTKAATSSGIWACPSDKAKRNTMYHVRPGRIPHLPRSYTMNLLVSQYYGTLGATGNSARIQDVPVGVAMMGEVWHELNLLREDCSSASVFYIKDSGCNIYGQALEASHNNGRTMNFLKMDTSAQSLDYRNISNGVEITGFGPYGGYYYKW